MFKGWTLVLAYKPLKAILYMDIKVFTSDNVKFES